MAEFRPPQKPSKLRAALAVGIPLITLGPILTLALVAFGMTQIAYTVDGGSLEVQSGDVFFGSRTVPLSDVTDARVVVLHGGRRTKGTGMPGYCVGHFSYEGLGPVWQATNCSARAVVVRAKGQSEPLVVTPPEPEAFVTAITARTPTKITLPRPSSNPLVVAAAIALPLSLVVSTMVVALLIFGPKRLRYSLEDGELHVRSLFGHKRWPVRGMRARRYTPGRVWRVAGSAMPGYFTGLYRENGASLRVYATDIKRGILVEASDRVFINPEDEDAFLSAVEVAAGGER